MSTIPAGTVTFVFTDIEGSTKLLQELGEDYAEVAREHRRIVREQFGEAAMRTALDCAERYTEDRGHLLLGKVRVVPQDQHHAPILRNLLQSAA